MQRNNKLPLSRIIISFLALPVMVIVIIPLILHNLLPPGLTVSIFKFCWQKIVAIIFGLAGFALLCRTNLLFVREGRGTLAPWSPPDKLVIRGPYRYTRQPMIVGVLLLLLSEFIYLSSWASIIWFIFFLTVNLIYIPLVEERNLKKRFGEAYDLYRKHVPRWIPHLHPWKIED